jgi:TetR/AcrR family transcriptional regulator, regulator of cefoperazone and chloramphenicol sensitivity
MGSKKDSEITKAKIVEAAGQLFAEKSFDGVTVRDIVSRADTHLSALNYHFKSKDVLYREVLLKACDVASIPDNEQKYLLELDPKRALFVLIKESLKKYNQQSINNWCSVVVTKEIWAPTKVFKELLENYFKPEMDFVAKIIGKIVNLPSESYSVRLGVLQLVVLVECFGLYDHLIDAVADGLLNHIKRNDLIVDQIMHLVIEAAKLPMEK